MRCQAPRETQLGDEAPGEKRSFNGPPPRLAASLSPRETSRHRTSLRWVIARRRSKNTLPDVSVPRPKSKDTASSTFFNAVVLKSPSSRLEIAAASSLNGGLMSLKRRLANRRAIISFFPQKARGTARRPFRGFPSLLAPTGGYKPPCPGSP